MSKKILFILAFLYLISVLFSQNFEGFESGNFYTYNWQFSGDADWIITASNPYEGLYCAQAGDIDHDEISTLSITMETTFIGDISFYWRISSQSSCDNLVFYIDGDEVENISGSQDWELYSLSIEPGNHTFAWSYEKDSSITSGLDTGWIDNITFPPTTTFDNDLAALLITGPGAVYSGNSAIYNILVKNYGNNPQDNYTVKLYREGGIELDVLNVTETLESEEEITHNLVWIVPPDEPAGYTYVYGEVILAGDEDLSNNTTDIFNVMILEIGLIEIRVGYGTHQTNWYPFNFYFENNISETIYFPAEINHTGIIHAIAYYNNFTSYLSDKSVKIWMNVTTQSNLTNGWIPATSLNLVFEGMVDFPSGSNTIIIPLDSPFQYTGGNLVVMTYRVWENFTYNINDRFNETTTTLYYDRTRAVNDDSVIYPNNPPAVSYLFSRFPNTSFFLELDGLGVIEGYVYDSEGSIITSASITIEETQITTVSNGSAFYRFGNVFEGAYNLTASKSRYASQTLPATVIEDETIVIDFNLIPLGTVEVTGHVVGSDQPDIGLENAYVTLAGNANFVAFTDSLGDFIFPEVYENSDYTMEISRYGYDSYSEIINVGYENLDLGTITLPETTFPPANVQATQDSLGMEVTLTWYPPTGYDRVFESYNVYRFLEMNHYYPNEWLLIGEEIIDTFFIDTGWAILIPHFYQYAVTSVYTNGVESEPAFSNVIEKEMGNSAQDIIQNCKTGIRSIFPNPFKPSGAGRSPATTISFSIAQNAMSGSDGSSFVTLEIYNIKGQKVKELNIVTSSPGHILSVTWDGTDENGKSQPTGIYFINLKVDKKSIDRKKCLLLK